MAASKHRVYVGSFRSPAAAGAQAYTGIGFQPKALYIFSANTAQAQPEFNHFNYWSGSFTDGTNHVALTSISFDNNGTTDLSQGVRTDSVILAEDTAGGTQHRATFTSFDVDGFTFNWTNIFASQQRYYFFVAIGGDEVEVQVGVITSNTATGAQSLTGLPFKPAGVIFMPAQNAGTTEASLTYPAIGYTDGVNQGASYVWSEEGAAASNTKRYQRIDKCFAIGKVADGTVLAEAGITSFNEDGFTFNLTTAPASAIRLFYLTWSVLPFKVGVITQPAASGSQATTGLGMTPGAVLLQSVNAAASTGVQDGNDFSIGVGSAIEQRAMWMADKDGADPVEASRYTSLTITYASGVVAPTASTLACSASLASMDYDGYTLAHTADGTQRQIIVAAFSSQYSHRNRVSGQGHTVIGHDNDVSGKNNTVVGNQNRMHGENGTIIGHRSTLFNLDGVPRTLEGDDKFEVYGEIGGDLGGAAGNAFATVAVSGESDVVAEVPGDTLTLVAGTNVVITTDPTTDEVTINAPSAAGALVLLEQHTAANSAALDFTSCISATYDTYQIELVNVVPASDASFLMRMSTDGGSSYDAGANYINATWQANQGTFDAPLNGGATDTEILVTNSVESASPNSLNGSMKLYNPASAALYKMVTGQTATLKSDGNFYSTLIAGQYTSATAVDAFRFLFASGNIASGTIRVYGVAK